MAFFQSLPAEDELASLPERVRPEWLAPPATHVPGIIPCRDFISRSSTAVVALIELRAYPRGCLFELGCVGRLPEPTANLREIGLDAMFNPPMPGEPLLPELLRFGVALPDGRTATTIESARLYAHEQGEPEPPVLMPAGGYCNLADERTIHWRSLLWLWPAPPADAFELVVE